jgi:hypothetical protein
VSQHQSCQGMHAQGSRRRAAHIPHLIDEVVGPRDQFGAVAQERLADLAETNHPRAAVKQRRADIVLQLLDPRRHHGARDPQLPRRFGKVLGLRHPDEGFDVLQTVHAATVAAARRPRSIESAMS